MARSPRGTRPADAECKKITMSLYGYRKKTRPANWTGTPSGKRLLRSAAARSAKSAAKRKAGRSSKFSAGLLYQGVPIKLSRKLYASQPAIKHFSPVWRKPIRRETPAHAKARAAYNKQREAFLRNHLFCECCPRRDLTRPAFASEDVHHKRGRGKFLLDETTWVAVCRLCHRHIHDNPAWAYQNNFTEKRI